MKKFSEFLAEEKKFTVKQETHYVWTRVPDGGRFIHTYKHRKAWGVYDGNKLLYGGFGPGSNTHAQRATISSKKAALAWIEGYNAGKELGEYPALRKASENGRRGEEQKAFRDGVYTAIKK